MMNRQIVVLEGGAGAAASCLGVQRKNATVVGAARLAAGVVLLVNYVYGEGT